MCKERVCYCVIGGVFISSPSKPLFIAVFCTMPQNYAVEPNHDPAPMPRQFMQQLRK